MFDKAVLALPGIRAALAFSCVVAAFRALCVIGQAAGLGCAVVNLWQGAALELQLGWIALFFGCFAGRQVLMSVQDAVLERYAAARADELREALLDAVYTLGPHVAARRGSSALVASAVEGVDDVQTYVGLIIPKVVSVAVVPLVLLVAVFSLDWVSGVIALACFPFIILYMVMIGHTASDDAARRHSEFDRMANHFVDSLRGIDTLRAFGRARAHAARIYEASERFRELTMKTLRIATLSSAVLDLFSTLALAAVAIMLGFRLVDGTLSFLPALIVLIMVPEYFRPIREFASDYHASLDGKTALSSLNEILAEAKAYEGEGEEESGEGGGEESGEEALKRMDMGERASATELAGAAGSAGAVSGAGRPAGAVGSACELAVGSAAVVGNAGERAGASGERKSAPSLSFCDVSCSIDGFQALSEVSFSVEGPCKVGVVGTSGAGKSTLLNLVGGFADPASGAVSACGHPLCTLRGSAWQRRATCIPQDPYLFHATLRDNVAFYRPDASDAEVAHALELVGLGELVRELPQGMHTVVGSGARSLSGGEKQRVALARAFLDPSRDVLLFDEPTAHLDIETELELKARMLPLMEGKLVFFATHRLHWVADMDYVLVVEDGRIVWQGSAREWCGRHGVEYCAGADSDPSSSSGFGADAAAADAAANGKAVCVSGEAGETPACDMAESCKHASSPDAPASATPRAHLRDTWRADTWVRPFFVRHARTLAAALALGVTAFLFASALMFTSGYMISLAAALPLTVLALHVPSIFVRIFGIGKPALQYLERLKSHDWALRMTSELRRRLYTAFERMPHARRVRHGEGEVLGLLTEDVGHIQNLYLRTLFPIVSAWLVALVVVCALGVLSVPTALVVAFALVLVLGVAPLASLHACEGRLEQRKQVKAQLYDVLADDVLGVADWLFADRRHAYVQRHRSLQQRVRALDADVARFGRVRDVCVQVVFGLVVVALLVWAAIAFPSTGAAGAGSSATAALAAFGSENAPAYAPNWIAAFVLCFLPLAEAFSPVSEAMMGLVTYGDSVARLNALTEGKRGSRGGAEVSGGAGASDSAGVSAGVGASAASASASPSANPSASDTASPPANPSAPAAAPNASGVSSVPNASDIVFEHVTFTYDGGTRAVLRDVSLEVPYGQKLAVLGRSGAGKSTLAALLRGETTPDAGRVYVGGRAASSYGEDMAHVVGVIQQNPHLFNQTLRENVALGRAEATDAEIEQALSRVGLGALVRRLPRGLDTVVDEDARNFSGGERHRIALARVLMSQAPVVLLDEPFSGLDPETEQALLRTISEVFSDRTVVMITHHLQGVASCDRVVFVEDGVIALDGAPCDLARENERYRRLLAFDGEVLAAQ